MKLVSYLLALVSALLIAACGGGDSVPLDNAAEVKTTFDAAPSRLQSWYSQSKEERGDVQMMLYPVDLFLPEPFHLVVSYRGRIIYDEQRWLITERHAVMSDGTDVVVVSEHVSAGDWSGSSIVFINGEKITRLQSLPVPISGQDYPAAVRDIREYRDGWIMLVASLNGRGGYYVYRWAMYHPKTGEFVDCGEYGSNREPSWGPPMSSICRQR